MAKFASLLGTVLAALLGAAASQTLAFIQAYQQRLGGHVDEAQRAVLGLQGGTLAGMPAEPAARDQLVAVFSQRLAELRTAQDAISQSGVFGRPVAFLQHMDRDIASATFAAFTPAVPLDPASLGFAFAGIAVGWMIWQAGQGALAALARGRRRG